MSREMTSSGSLVVLGMDPPSDRWDLVIKVKHGNTLRRIGAFVHGQLMDLNMSKLRAKIVNLFKFNPDADFILTYTDEDGDVVTIDDDDELRDAVIGQHLNPLRINVQLKSSTTAGTDERSDVSSPTAAKSPKSGNKPLNVHSAVEEALKSVPEPFKSAISDLSGDILKVATSTPAIAHLVEYLCTLRLSNVSHPIHGATDTGDSSGQSSGGSAHLLDLNVSNEISSSGVPTQETNATLPVRPTQEQDEYVNKDELFETAAAALANLNHDIIKDKNVSPYPFDDSLNCWPSLTSQKECTNGNSVAISAFPSNPNVVHRFQNLEALVQSNSVHEGSADMISVDSTSKQLPGNTPAPPISQIGIHSDGPPNRRSVTLQTVVPPSISPIPYPKSRMYYEHIRRNFHRGIQCDGCGMLPILGVRFKSKVKNNYDLCNFCFSQIGNETDYIRIDQAFDHIPPLSKELQSQVSEYGFPSSNVSIGSGWTGIGKLESRFIRDVTVVDGTVMAPSSHFTKIWRMQNNGSVAWPSGSQLVWVGGDQFGAQGSTALEIPANGLPVEGELDIAIDFTAPSTPGRYVSYWRMASPSGEKFGQRVWVLIHVDYHRPNLNLAPESNGLTGLGITDVNAEPLNLNLPPASIGVIDVNAEPFDDDFPEANITCTAEALAKQSLSASDFGLYQSAPAAVTPITTSSPSVDLPSQTSPFVAPPSVPSEDAVDQLEQTLLKELEDMGFQQLDLNKDILRRNGYDLVQCIEDLCGFADE